MNVLLLQMCTLMLITGCAHAAPTSAGLAISTNQAPINSSETSGTLLDGLSVDGHIRAQGLAGLFSVPGSLIFSDGQLIWSVAGDIDTGSYASWICEDDIEFRAEHKIDNGERVFWSGRYDGEEFQGVTAVWSRMEGDIVHDLLLPDRVILDFTPE